MAFNDTEKTDAKIEQAYLDLLAKTLSAAKEKWSEPWLRSIVNLILRDLTVHATQV